MTDRGTSAGGATHRVFSPIALDEPLQWSCSSKGWNCCTNVRIPVRPYDMIRLRHSLESPAHELINSETVTFTWDEAGVLNGLLAIEPHPEGSVCTFLEDVTNLDAKRRRDTDPDRFAGLPQRVQDAANSDHDGEWRVAALCRVHTGRPEACRGFPFQRDPAREQREHESPVIQMFRCGTCSLPGETTVRQILEGNGLDVYWRADDAWLAATRYARGRKNFNTFELNGEAGSVYFDLEDPQYVQYFKYTDPKTGQKIESHLTGWQKIHVTNSEHPYMSHWWVPGCTIGYEHTFTNALADFLESLETGKPVQPDFRSGLRTQKVCDAVLASAKSGKWVEIA